MPEGTQLRAVQGGQQRGDGDCLQEGGQDWDGFFSPAAERLVGCGDYEEESGQERSRKAEYIYIENYILRINADLLDVFVIKTFIFESIFVS